MNLALYMIAVTAGGFVAGYAVRCAQERNANVRDAATLRAIAAAMTPHEARVLPLGKWADRLREIADRMERRALEREDGNGGQ